jgi:hypothetical protein
VRATLRYSILLAGAYRLATSSANERVLLPFDAATEPQGIASGPTPDAR